MAGFYGDLPADKRERERGNPYEEDETFPQQRRYYKGFSSRWRGLWGSLGTGS
jgi:hypothetical protein